MQVVDCHRPPKFYLYSERRLLERSLALGEFCLSPTVEEPDQSPQILPFQSPAARAVPAATYLTLGLATEWNNALFDEFTGADCCLVIHNTEEFGERIHRAAQNLLPTWAGIDAAVSYGVPSRLGKVFSRKKQNADKKEWLFAWRPTQAAIKLSPVFIQIGSIESLAELRDRSSD